MTEKDHGEESRSRVKVIAKKRITKRQILILIMISSIGKHLDAMTKNTIGIGI